MAEYPQRLSARCARPLTGLIATGMFSFAFAVLPPAAYERLASEAPGHVQLEVTGVAVPEKQQGWCEVHGKVKRIFRDTQRRLAPEQEIVVSIMCTREPRAGETREPRLVGGFWSMPQEKLQATRYLELYLDSASASGRDGFSKRTGPSSRNRFATPAGALFWAIDTPTEAPRHVVPKPQ
ncbi:MAG: hypothetical protein HY323_07680 [Betaproteobacteria bacterium]|nr:hypothetical protein [Betaproteobacteria bacterium]